MEVPNWSEPLFRKHQSHTWDLWSIKKSLAHTLPVVRQLVHEANPSVAKSSLRYRVGISGDLSVWTWATSKMQKSLIAKVIMLMWMDFFANTYVEALLWAGDFAVRWTHWPSSLMKNLGTVRKYLPQTISCGVIWRDSRLIASTKAIVVLLGIWGKKHTRRTQRQK